jgi:hypothetical protein
LLKRILGAARLDPQVYDEVASDTRATPQAVLVVALAGLATGIGFFGSEDDLGFVLFRGVAEGLIAWGVWAITSYFVGTTLFRSREPNATANWRQLVRTTGFAQSPGLLRVVAFIPYVGFPIFVVTFFWQLAAMTVAVRQTLGYASTWRALTVVLAGFIIATAVVAALGR